MGINVVTEKVLIWDEATTSMSPKYEVTVEIKTNKGTVLFEEGPLYCETANDVLEAIVLLKERLVKKLPGISATQA